LPLPLTGLIVLVPSRPEMGDMIQLLHLPLHGIHEVLALLRGRFGSGRRVPRIQHEHDFGREDGAGEIRSRDGERDG
jgi:hypothetical protein